jgi:photosystem II stability/assembly factor-like uncharacterized protein
MFAAGSVATVVIAASVGIGIAARGGNGLGIHTIAPAGSSTTRSSAYTDVRPTVPTTTFARNGVAVAGLPMLAFADALHGWRVEPVSRRTLEHTTDGGDTWTAVRIDVPGDDTSLTGVLAIDDRHVFSIVVNGVGNAIPRLVRTTDGVHWERALGAGLDDRSNALFVSFVDATHGWGLTQYGGALTTADGGDHWRTMTQPPADHFAAVCLATPGVGWAATGQSVYRSDDDGATWTRQFVMPYGGEPALVCRGSHVAFAGFSHGAGQSTGGFVRSDDAGAHWRPLTEDTATGPSPATAPGFPETQARGLPTAMTVDGTLVFIGACEVCPSAQHSIVTASPVDRFIVGRFDDSRTQRFEVVDATAVDSTHVLAEVRRLDPNSSTGGPVSFYSSSDGGHTWQLRSSRG